MYLHLRHYILKMLKYMYIYKCKNIPIKMLKDVGMTVAKIRETRAVYMYAAIRGMRACNNNNMRNLK